MPILHDTEVITPNNSQQNSFPVMLTKMFTHINWRIGLFIFVLGIFVFSDVFIELFLSGVPGATSLGNATTKGTIIQMVIITIAYLLVDVLVQSDVV